MPPENSKVALAGTVSRKCERKFHQISQILFLQVHFKLPYFTEANWVQPSLGCGVPSQDRGAGIFEVPFQL